MEDVYADYSEVASEDAETDVIIGLKIISGTSVTKEKKGAGADVKAAFANAVALPSLNSFAGITAKDATVTRIKTDCKRLNTQRKIFNSYFKLFNIAARLVVNIALPQRSIMRK